MTKNKTFDLSASEKEGLYDAFRGMCFDQTKNFLVELIKKHPDTDLLYIAKSINSFFALILDPSMSEDPFWCGRTVEPRHGAKDTLCVWKIDKDDALYLDFCFYDLDEPDIEHWGVKLV